MMRKDSAVRNTAEHRSAPWISSEQPITLLRCKLPELPITRHDFIEPTLGREGGQQIIRTPDKRHADVIRILFAHRDTLPDPIRVITAQLLLEMFIHEIVKAKMPEIHE